MPIYLPNFKSFDQKSRLLGKFRECLKKAKKVVAIYVFFSFISMLNKCMNLVPEPDCIVKFGLGPLRLNNFRSTDI